MIQLTATGWPAKTEAMPGSPRSVLLPAALLLLAVAGCPQPKEPPIISSIEGSRSVEARDSADYTCNTSDPGLKQLSYLWSQEGGSLGWDWGKKVRWFAPESSGHGAIRVTVMDEDGLTASDSFTVTIRAETAGMLFWDAAVKAGDFQSWADTVRAGYRLYGYCGSDTGEIFLMVMDDSNFTKWMAGQAAVPLFQRRPWDTKSIFSVPISAFGLYHVIMDNTRGVEDCDYWLNVWKAGP
jgi:hypothetical protein